MISNNIETILPLAAGLAKLLAGTYVAAAIAATAATVAQSAAMVAMTAAFVEDGIIGAVTAGLAKPIAHEMEAA